MNLRDQRGMTLVEMLIAMSVTAIVMVALAGIVFAAEEVGITWGQRTYLSQESPLLPNALQADAHRFPPCDPAGSGGSSLHLCLPDGLAAITYATNGSCPCDLMRTNELTGGSTVVVRGLLEQPAFTTTCTPAGSVSAGSISLSLRYHGDAAPQPPVVVYFRAPAGRCNQ